MKDVKRFNVNSNISEYQLINPNFAKVLVKIAYADENRNKTDIPKQAFDKASGTLPYIPIVGHYLEDQGIFGGHDEELVDTEDGMDLKSLTIPYGVVSNEQPFWKSFKELDGSFKDYYCCYGYLWIGRYPELEGIKTGDYKQSMEILVNSSEKSEDGYLVIKDFTFDALCILQRDEPCFEGSIITTNFSINNFEKNYKEMINELKKYTLETFNEGGKKVEKEKITGNEELFTLSQNQINNAINDALEDITTIKQNWDGTNYETQRYYLVDTLPSENIAIICDISDDGDYDYYGVPYVMTGDEAELDFANMKEYVIGDWRLYVDGDEGTEPDDDDDTEDIVGSFAKKIVENIKKESADKQTDLEKTEDEEYKALKNELDSKNEEYSNLEKELEKVKADYTTLNSNYSALESDKVSLDEEIKDLRQFKADKELEFKETQYSEVLEKYTELQPIEGYEDLVKDKFDYSLEELETKLKVFAFDNNVIISKKQKFSTKNNQPLNLNIENKIKYEELGDWDILAKYIKE